MQNTYWNREVVTASQFSELTHVPERGTHDDRLIAELLVIIEDCLNRLNTRVLLGTEVLFHSSLVPVQNTGDEGGDEKGTSLGSSNGLDNGEHKGQVAIDAMLLLQDLGGLDTFPG